MVLNFLVSLFGLEYMAGQHFIMGLKLLSHVDEGIKVFQAQMKHLSELHIIVVQKKLTLVLITGKFINLILHPKMLMKMANTENTLAIDCLHASQC